MEIDELICELETFADEAKSRGAISAEMTLRKAAEVIRLQRECIVDGYNERWHMMIDDMEG